MLAQHLVVLVGLLALKVGLWGGCQCRARRGSLGTQTAMRLSVRSACSSRLSTAHRGVVDLPQPPTQTPTLRASKLSRLQISSLQLCELLRPHPACLPARPLLRCNGTGHTIRPAPFALTGLCRPSYRPKCSCCACAAACAPPAGLSRRQRRALRPARRQPSGVAPGGLPNAQCIQHSTSLASAGSSSFSMIWPCGCQRQRAAKQDEVGKCAANDQQHQPTSTRNRLHSVRLLTWSCSVISTWSSSYLEQGQELVATAARPADACSAQ